MTEEVKYSYKGLAYLPHSEKEDDVTKIYHDVYEVSSNSFISILDFSPYEKLSEEHFKWFVDKDFPGRELYNLSSPLNTSFIEKELRNKQC